MHALVEKLFAEVEHGDVQHRAWLREKLEAWDRDVFGVEIGTATELLRSLVDRRPNWDGDKTTLTGLARALVEFDKFDLECAQEIGADRRRLERENAVFKAALSLSRVAVDFADGVVDENPNGALETAVEASAAATETMRAALDLQSEWARKDREILADRRSRRAAAK